MLCLIHRVSSILVKTDNKLKRRRWLTAYAPLFIWVVVIIDLGSGMGAVNETSRIIRPLLEFLFHGALPETLSIYHGYIRKFAHFAEYAVLAFLAYRAFNPRRPFLFSFLLVALVAIADETNQSFINTRTASPYDVLLDISGGVAMLFAIWLVRRQRSVVENQPLNHA
jgi:VanZ family protein